ncbi:hypothetical protein [Ramlibacter alkalitolerans]|uniref:Uncharacterized protein n=1 Tax=Ramlibacter alkalitolerans TaxID=2039631 RepID=A0ABS1JPZ6_9BURK|nr:hypothetical protein [Ramlibacter alkalitolerans]MBL0426201.1 hypothetical protein [Ramlibacter alkalitolerans]
MASFALDTVRNIFTRRAGPLPPAAERPRRPELIFRLRAWPRLPENGRTAEVYRILSVMSNQPVNRQWLLGRFRLAPQQLDALLQQLVAQGSVEVIDPAAFAQG